MALMRPFVRALLLVLVVLGPLQLGLSGPASAHVRVGLVAPLDGARLTEMPTRLEFYVSEPVDASKVRLLHDGESVGLGSAVPDGAGRASVAVPAGLPDASYVVEIAVSGWDGHPTTARFSFVVGDGPLVRASGTVNGSASPGSLVLVLRDAHTLGVLAVLVLLGGLTFRRARPELLAEPGPRRLLLAAAVVAVLATATVVLLHPAYEGGRGWSDALPSRDVLTRTPFQRLTLVRLGALVAWAAVIRRPSRAATNVAIIAALVVVLTLAGTSHPMASRTGLVLGAIHLAALGLWIGGVALAAAAPRLTWPDEAFARWQRMALMAAGAALASGVALAGVLVLPAPASDGRTMWLAMLTAKLVLVAVLLTAGLRMRTAWLGGRSLTDALRAEAALAAVVVAVAGLLAWQPL
ncbi:copper resistance protein CopC [Nocardioides jejuensis]|uniref:Copper resistance protein CopC n=1 Tax=Nocardioides jejuensis TaxID=2502782 RepID=A0A4R1CJI8_9ACTN|nr:copper resistance protein CopC [Nocardioides jejuensis]